MSVERIRRNERKEVFVEGELCALGKKEVAATISFRVVGAPGKFCKGIAVLLDGIESQGSLKRAAESMGMAYSKAWNLARTTEKNLGVKLIERDGARGSSLTPEGAELLKFYKKSVAQLSKTAVGLLDKKGKKTK